MFGIVGFDGAVSERYSETGRNYILIIDGDRQKVAREVYQAARVGSEIREPTARPYLILDRRLYASVFQWWLFGFLGTLLLAAVVALDTARK